MLFELINPSDKIHFEASSRAIADVCVVSISSMYAATEINPETLEEIWSGGILQFSGIDTLKEAHGIDDLDKWIIENTEDMNTCFKSFAYGSVKDFYFYKKAVASIDDPEKKQAFIDDWDDKHRSSMNKIVAYAHSCEIKSN